MRSTTPSLGIALAVSLLALARSAGAQAPAPTAPPKAAAPAAKPDTKDAEKPDAKDAPPPCPPGAYCEEAEMAPPPPPKTTEPQEVYPEEEEVDDGSTTVVIPPPPPGTDPNRPRVFVYHPTPDGRGQVVVVDEGMPPPGYPGWEPAPPPPPQKPRRRVRPRRFGLAMRVEGVLMPRRDGDGDNGGMGGLGLSLRYRPVSHFAFDFGADFIGGVDANGLERQEVPLTLGALLYLNPRSLAQFYLLGGLNWSFARVFANEPRLNLAGGTRDDYTYFGGHFGLGIELRLSRLVGINVDGLAFVRTRTDDDGGGSFPELYNARTGEGSNSSAAGLLRGGVVFWW